MIKKGKSRKGQAIAELPIVLWVIIMILAIPFVDLVAFSIRYNFLLAASRDAAYHASRSKTFLQNVSSTELSAVNAATQAAQQTASKFSEIRVNSVACNIVITRLSNGTVTKQSTPLQQPADTSTFAYQIETVLNGSANPLLNASSNYWANIPGLTSAIPVIISSRSYFENPQGLNH